MASLLLKPFKIFLKPTLGSLVPKSGLSTGLSKLPGNYAMALHKGLADHYTALNIPSEIASIILDHEGFEMYLSLEEKNDHWRYKSSYFIEGRPIGGKEYSFTELHFFQILEYCGIKNEMKENKLVQKNLI